MSLVRRDGPDRWSVEAEDLLALPDYVRDEVAGRMLHAAAGRKKDIESVHIDQMTDLLYKKAGKRIDLPWGLAARRTDSRIIVSRNEGVPEGDREEKYDREGLCIKVCLPDYAEGLQWTVPLDIETGLVMQYRSYHGQQIIKSDCEKYFDYDRISKELSIRTRRPGDYLVFNDQGEHKKLSRFFIDEKIPADERESRMLLADGSHILWIIGRRISEACKVTSGTKQMLAVSLTKYKR